MAAYHGEACISAGTTTPLSPERLAELYPTHQHYVEELRAATDTAVAGGLLLCGDAETVLREASASDIGGHDPFTAAPACA